MPNVFFMFIFENGYNMLFVYVLDKKRSKCLKIAGFGC